MIPIDQIYQILPCKLAVAKRYVATLREDGTLKPRNKKEHSMRLVTEAYNSGITDIDELAEMYSLKRGTAIVYLNKMGVCRPRPTTYNSHFNKKAEAIIEKLQQSNLSHAEIAKQFSVSRQYVHQLKKRMERLKDA
jgi:transposase